MSETNKANEPARKNPHYDGMRVTLRRWGEAEWLMFAECDEGIVASVNLSGVDEATALERATTLASWFDAELVVEKVGVE